MRLLNRRQWGRFGHWILSHAPSKIHGHHPPLISNEHLLVVFSNKKIFFQLKKRYQNAFYELESHKI